MREIANIYFNKVVFNLFGKLERFQGEWEKVAATNPTWLIKRKDEALLESALSSVRINNGGDLTFDDFKPFLHKDFTLEEGSSKEIREGYAYFKTLQYVVENINDLELDRETVCTFHYMLTEYVPEDILPQNQKGVYKNSNNDIVKLNRETGEKVILIKATEPGIETEEAMARLIEDFRELERSGEVAYLVIVSAFLINFLSILPFKASNGELSRLITTFLLLKGNYKWAQYLSHEKGIEKLKDKFFIALRKTHLTLVNNEPNYLPWLEFIFRALSEELQIPELVDDDVVLIGKMNRNELKVYKMVKRYSVCSTSFILNKVSMTRDGLKTLLSRMVVGGYLERVGRGRSTKYKIAST
ncbi:MAG: Fic family protein [Nitrospinae bacterium]|nr:Fic family protein [Nitrospinota bacterium]